jgi:membrane protein YqaA with SNARE-associated domain
MKNPIKQLYNWVLEWAEKPSAVWALGILAFAESSFFPIPPDVLLIPLALGNRKKWIKLAVVTTLSSVAGACFGYWIGWHLWWSSPEVFSPLAQFFFRVIPGFSPAMFESVRVKYELYNFWVVFTAGFTPLPYKIITISAGSFLINFPLFVIASIVSRGARFFLVAGLVAWFGEPIRTFIDKYFNWLALLFTALLIIGFILIKGIL